MIATRLVRSRIVRLIIVAILACTVVGLRAPTQADAATTMETSAANWARGKVNSTAYRYLCLKFVYDAYINAGMPRATIDAKAGYVSNANSYPIDEWNYWMNVRRPDGTLHVGADAAPPVGAIIYYSNRLGHDYSHATISVGGGQQISPDTDKVNGPQSVTTNSYRTMLGWWLPDVAPGPTPITPVGFLDVAQSESPGTVHVAGWASDGNDPNAALDIHVDLGGHAGDAAAVGTDIGTAGIYRADVGAHGFDKTITAAVGTYLACAYAINVGPASPNPELGCKTVTVGAPIPPCPAPGSPAFGFVAGTALTSGSAPTMAIRASWSGAGGCSYRLQQQTGATWTTLYSGTATSYQLQVAPASSLPTLQVIAVNSAGQASAPTPFPTRGLDAQQDDQLVYPNGGGFKFTNSVYWGNTLTLMGAAGVTAQTNVLADRVAVVATTGPYYGAVQIYIDGTLQDTLDTYADTEKNRQVIAAYNLSRAPHLVKIVTVGTTGRPAVALDGIASLW